MNSPCTSLGVQGCQDNRPRGRGGKSRRQLIIIVLDARMDTHIKRFCLFMAMARFPKASELEMQTKRVVSAEREKKKKKDPMLFGHGSNPRPEVLKGILKGKKRVGLSPLDH